MNHTNISGGHQWELNGGALIRVVDLDWTRNGRLFCDVAILAPGGNDLLGGGRHDLSDTRQRWQIAQNVASRNGAVTQYWDSALLSIYDALRFERRQTSAPAPAFRSLEEVANSVAPPGPSIVDGLMEAGGLYALASKPKVGKTIALCNLAHAVATGGEWFGRQATKGRVRFFQLEDSARTIVKRFQRITDGNWPPDIFLHIVPFRLTAENYELTVEACRGASLVICDPIIQAAEVRDWNSSSEVRDAYEYWRRLARDTDAAVVVAAHHRKMDGDYGDQIGGSIQAQATVDGIIELYRDKSLTRTERKLSFVGREWGDREDEVINLDVDTLCWLPVGKYSEVREMEQAVRMQRTTVIVKDALPTKPPGKTIDELRLLTGLNDKKLRPALTELGADVKTNDAERKRNEKMMYWYECSSS